MLQEPSYQQTQNSQREIQPLLTWLIYLAIFIIVFFLYAPSLQHDYVWDDLVILFQPSGYLRDDWIYHALTRPFIFSENYYRPLAVLSIFADFRLGNTSAFISHLINLCLFFINGLLMLLLAQLLCKKIQLSNIKTLLACCCCLSFYLLHSSHLESAVWVSGRFDLMMTTFLLLALLIDIKIQTPIYRMLLVSLLFFLAALCKEMAAFFIPVFIIWHFLQENINNHVPLRQYIKSNSFSINIRIYACLFITGLIYLAVRYVALGYLVIEEFNSELHYGDAFQRAATILKALFLYCKVLLLPFLDSSIQYPQTYPVAFNDTSALAGALILAALFFVAIFVRNHLSTLLLIPLMIFIVAIFPVLHVLPLKIGDNIIHERFLAFPLAVFSLASLPAISAARNKLTVNFKKLAILFFTLWCFVSIANIHSLIPLWNNSLILWSWTYNKHKNDASALAYGQTLYHYGNFQEAYNLAEEIKAKTGNVYLLQANCLLADKQYNHAGSLYKKAIEAGLADKPLALTLANYAYVMMQVNNTADVTQLLNQSLVIDSQRPVTYYYYAYYYYLQKDFSHTRESLQKAIHFSSGTTKINALYRSFLENINLAELEYEATGILPAASETLPY